MFVILTLQLGELIRTFNRNGLMNRNRFRSFKICKPFEFILIQLKNREKDEI